LKHYLNQIFFEKSIYFKFKVAGLVLIIISVIFFNTPTVSHIKIGMLFVLIGGFFLLLLTHTETYCRLSSREVVIIMSGWVILLSFISEVILENSPPEILFLSIAIGITAIKVLTNEIISSEVKKRLNIFLFLFFLILVAIIVQKIINVLNI
jgi:hypothetical protein